MPQVSKRFLKKEKLKKIFDLFFDLVAALHNRNEAEALLAELLTPTEKIMIAKRIACFYLIYKNIQSSEIAETIKLSISTVSHFKYIFDNSKIIKNFLTNRLADEKIKNLLEDVFVELWFGSLRKGSDWSYSKKVYYEHQRNRRDPL